MKIAIIGAGPGGLYAALAAAKKGMQVELFEKRRVGEGIVCGECIFDSLRIMPRPGLGLLRPVDEILLAGTQGLSICPFQTPAPVDARPENLAAGSGKSGGRSRR